jgi:hypothetical protein
MKLPSDPFITLQELGAIVQAKYGWFVKLDFLDLLAISRQNLVANLTPSLIQQMQSLSHGVMSPLVKAWHASSC